MRKQLKELEFVLLNLWFEIKSWSGKIKRHIWNRGIKLQYDRLWIRKDEFHPSLNMDIEAMFEMDLHQRKIYLNDLMRRREIAHQRDF